MAEVWMVLNQWQGDGMRRAESSEQSDRDHPTGQEEEEGAERTRSSRNATRTWNVPRNKGLSDECKKMYCFFDMESWWTPKRCRTRANVNDERHEQLVSDVLWRMQHLNLCCTCVRQKWWASSVDGDKTRFGRSTQATSELGSALLGLYASCVKVLHKCPVYLLRHYSTFVLAFKCHKSNVGRIGKKKLSN